MPNKLLRPNVGIYIATADAFGLADITASSWKPTLAQLTDPSKVYNVSPAITDAYTLNLTDSDTDNSLSVVDNAQVSVPTAYNYEVSLDGFRDAGTGASYYNKFKELLADAALGTKYYIIKRTGKKHSDAFAVGDNVSVFGVVTDYADDLVADGEMIRVGARFLQTGEVAVNTTVAAGTAGAGFWPTTSTATGTKIQSNGNVVVYWVAGSAVSNESTFISSPSVAIITGTNGTNLTEAIAWDGYTLGQAESNKIDDKSILDRTNAKTRGFAQFSGSLTFFRPQTLTSVPFASAANNATLITLTSGSVPVTTGASGATSITINATTAANVKIGMKVTGTGVGTGALVTAVDAVNGVISLSVANSAAVSSAVFEADMDKIELGMRVTGTGVGTGAVITAIDKTNKQITVSVATTAAIASGSVVTLSTSYSLAYDLFKSATNSRPNGWLVTRVGKPAGTALAAGDVISVFKFTADAVMDNTEGEDSMKFMVNFQPQGLVGVNLTSVA